MAELCQLSRCKGELGFRLVAMLICAAADKCEVLLAANFDEMIGEPNFGEMIGEPPVELEPVLTG